MGTAGGFLSLLLLISLGLIWSTGIQCHEFYVGGTDGWVLHPSENYNQWAERNRFQVNDSLVFLYKKGEDSVLVVNKDDYDKCNTKNPIESFSDGYSVFKFDRSGPFFFISGKEENCNIGQKLIVVVMAVRNRTGSPSPPPAGSSASPPPAGQGPPAQTPGSSGGKTAPVPSPRSSSSSSSSSPSLFDDLSSRGVVSIGVAMAVVFGFAVGPF